MRYLILLSVISAFFITSCKEPTTYSNNMEKVINTWMNEHTLTTKMSRSGKFSSQLDQVNIYSFGFQRYIADVPIKNIKKLNVNLWLYFLTPNSKASLVIEILDPTGKQVDWQSYSFDQINQTVETWQEVNIPHFFTKAIDPNNLLKVYVWSPDAQTLYMDDMSVTFE